jgi:hypothetical protein
LYNNIYGYLFGLFVQGLGTFLYKNHNVSKIGSISALRWREYEQNSALLGLLIQSYFNILNQIQGITVALPRAGLSKHRKITNY